MQYLNPIAALFITVGLAGAAPAQTADDAPNAAQQAFDKADTDHDGALSLAEWKAMGRRERGFNFIDANHDGKVTPDEIRAAMARFRR
ncbi:EF-hand domain-containing protein [Sphingomonas nostoxanthinifaciens]|uniref:EF-hand domain-containing protein n=1 Tax=Sphingomonas nostoxanthinifaciens TaxID=2872652 RepID=UPI001CC1F9A6|nr:EF-hand domain-containing protein [Sphingomonas nostoxanthinifaciens]UAK23722.1 EF-hand domain-containing protein [Sphingomonas nostoxanthinifaciens]